MTCQNFLSIEMKGTEAIQVCKPCQTTEPLRGCVWRKVYKKKQPNSIHQHHTAAYDPTLFQMRQKCLHCPDSTSYVWEELDGRKTFTCQRCGSIRYTFE